MKIYEDKILQSPGTNHRKSALYTAGFNPNFVTGTYELPHGTVWHCCFDICWLEYDDESYELSHRPQLLDDQHRNNKSQSRLD